MRGWKAPWWRWKSVKREWWAWVWGHRVWITIIRRVGKWTSSKLRNRIKWCRGPASRWDCKRWLSLRLALPSRCQHLRLRCGRIIDSILRKEKSLPKRYTVEADILTELLNFKVIIFNLDSSGAEITSRRVLRSFNLTTIPRNVFEGSRTFNEFAQVPRSSNSSMSQPPWGNRVMESRVLSRSSYEMLWQSKDERALS